jgi:hypothetical protein
MPAKRRLSARVGVDEVLGVACLLLGGWYGSSTTALGASLPSYG